MHLNILEILRQHSDTCFLPVKALAHGIFLTVSLILEPFYAVYVGFGLGLSLHDSMSDIPVSPTHVF